MTSHDFSEDEDTARTILHDVQAQLKPVPGPRRNTMYLLIAAGLTEAAAFDIARSEPPESTASLILAAAELDRLAERQRRRANRR